MRHRNAFTLLVLAVLLATGVTRAGARTPGKTSTTRQLMAALQRQAPDRMQTLVARSFVAALTSGNVEAMLALCAERVSLEGRWLKGEEQLRPALSALAERAQFRALKVLQLQTLPLDQMVKHLGPPPDRLADATSRRDWVALVRLNQQGFVALLTQVGPFWRIKALTD